MTARPEARSPNQVGGGNSRPMPPSEALDATEAFLGRFVCFPSEYARVATSLWVAHSYLLEHFDSTPRLAFLSPEPGSGKTRALEVIGSLVRRPMHAVHCTPAALFRAVGDLDNRPTILFDEIDSVFGPKARENEELRAFLNAGHRRSGLTFRCESVGNTHTVVSFASFAAVALAGLHDVPDTIATRSVIVKMRRRGPGEAVEPYRLRVHEPDGLAIGEQLAAALDSLVIPEDPVLPAGVTDRPADVWEPLLAVAEGVGGAWPGRAAEACLHFVAGRAGAAEPSLSLLLLADLRRVFLEAGNPDALATAPLLAGLLGLEESPWRDLRGKPLDPSGLARRLRGYEIRSTNLRVGATVAKGYRQVDLSDAWMRYLPPIHGEPVGNPFGGVPQKPATGATPATHTHHQEESGTNRAQFREERLPTAVAALTDDGATREALAATSGRTTAGGHSVGA